MGSPTSRPKTHEIKIRLEPFCLLNSAIVLNCLTVAFTPEYIAPSDKPDNAPPIFVRLPGKSPDERAYTPPRCCLSHILLASSHVTLWSHTHKGSSLRHDSSSWNNEIHDPEVPHPFSAKGILNAAHFTVSKRSSLLLHLHLCGDNARHLEGKTITVGQRFSEHHVAPTLSK